MRSPLTKEITFQLLIVLAIGWNFYFFKGQFSKSQKKIASQAIREPGFEFSDLILYVKKMERIGYRTDKDLSPEYNDGQFLKAQFQLAPVQLELGRSDSPLFLLDCKSLVAAFAWMERNQFEPLYINPYHKVIARRL